MKVFLNDKFNGVSSLDIPYYLNVYRLWAIQNKIRFQLVVEEYEGYYAEFDNEEDAMLFKLTVFQDTHRNI